jgi:hypothetical protein
MTGYQSKRAAAQDKLDDDDIQDYKKPWVGLTKEDTLEIAERLGLADVAWFDLMIAIEAKLKERNA